MPAEHRRSTLLLTIPVRSILVQSTLLPIAALLLAFTFGSVLHPKRLYWYRWACGFVHLPSVSRVINMPLERTIFQLLVLFSIPLQLFALLEHWLRFSKEKPTVCFSLTKSAMAVSAVIFMVFLSLLAVVGERESGGLHAMFFGGFAISTYIYFIAQCLLTRWTIGENPTDIIKLKRQLTCLTCVSITIPIISILFTLYNVYCVEYTYELFALFEYATVAFILAFHVYSLSNMSGFIYVVHSSIRSRALRA
ncbi:hypothetical protein Q1695_002051 [Nippostrongylus brasiliensis]|nr:hypothetical protein Q1695_002051 [Nippostrongylus brasiliensis]